MIDNTKQTIIDYRNKGPKETDYKIPHDDLEYMRVTWPDREAYFVRHKPTNKTALFDLEMGFMLHWEETSNKDITDFEGTMLWRLNQTEVGMGGLPHVAAIMSTTTEWFKDSHAVRQEMDPGPVAVVCIPREQ